MAEKIVISLVTNTGSDGQTGNEQNSSSEQQPKTKDNEAKAVAAYAATKLASAATSELIAWAEYSWNMNLSLNDDYLGQRNKQIALESISKTVSFISNVASSTAAGAMAGGVAGAIVGLVAGMATSAASIIRGTSQSYQQEQININQMQASLEFTRQRAGWSTEAASIGEDL